MILRLSLLLRLSMIIFDALRLRIEGDKAILEYGVRRKVEEYEEIEEDEQIEVRLCGRRLRK